MEYQLLHVLLSYATHQHVLELLLARMGTVVAATHFILTVLEIHYLGVQVIHNEDSHQGLCALMDGYQWNSCSS